MENVSYYKSFLPKGLKKLFTIMRITVILLFVALFQMVAVESSYSQSATISVKAEQISLTDLFSQIEHQSEFLFFYVDEEVKNIKVNIQIKNKQIDEVLSQALVGTDLTYTINDRNINITRKTYATQQKQTKHITGKITDVNGEPIIGANVIEKGTTNGIITDIEGNFDLNVTSSSILQISYIGYLSQEIQVGNKNLFNIKLIEDTQDIDEVVVVGYGTQKKANLTGSVTSVSIKDLTNLTLGQTSMALQGLIPGVAITQRSGQPGADGGTISIRGKTTLNNNDALILVDGVEMGINDIDPSLIESISVLKDAASSAIYGSRAANGVILITTKRAEADKFTVSYNGYVGWQSAIDLPDKVGAIDHMLMTNTAYTNIGKSPLYSDEYIKEYRQGILTDPDRYPDTDWYDECLTNSGLMQNHFVTLSGGSKRIRTNASFGYMDQQGIIENSNYKRYTFRMNTDMDISSTLSARIDAHLNMIDQKEPSRTDAFHWMSRIPAIQAGVLSTGQWGEGWNGDNPIAFTNDGGLKKQRKPTAVVNVALNYQPFEWLTFQGNYAANYWENHTSDFRKVVQTYKYDGSPYYRSPQKSTLNDQTSRNLRNLLTASATFDKQFNDHGIKAMVGYQQEDHRYDMHKGYRENYAFPDYPVLDAGGEENQKAYGNSYEWSLRSIFGRINYDYQGKYLFEANMRYDGSSRFAEGNKWGIFPSVSAGWRISEEAFWEPIRNIIDNLKFRASWGQLGNQNVMNADNSAIDPYPFSSNVNLDTKYIFDKTISSGAAITNMANRKITWETTTSTDIGIDATLFGKLNITTDYFYKVTDDILMKLNVPLIIGMDAPSQNAGKMENRGWEVSLSYADQVGDFNYRASFNISDVRNKILDMRGVNQTGLTVNREGHEMYSIYGLEAIGYIQPEDYDADGNYLGATQYGNFGPGDIKYKDQNGDGVINTSDYKIIGGTIPRYTFGLSLYGDYKGFDLSMLFQGVGKADGYINGQGIQTFIEGGTVQEQHKDYWTPENRNAKFPRLAFNETNNMQNSSFWMKNAAYIRLKNVQLGYALPKNVLRKTPISYLRFYVSGDNLLTIDSFWDGFDVEAPIGNGGYYPQLKTISFGVDLKF